MTSLKRGRVYFFQSMITWPCCFESVTAQYIMVRTLVAEEAWSPHGGQETKKEQKRARVPISSSKLSLPQ
jgi:hypothetical protein